MPELTSEPDPRSLEAIAAIAEETHHPLPVVKRVYEDEFARLRAKARITDYLVLFALRHTREALLGHRHT